MRRYESLVILDPDLPDEDIVGFTERYSELIKTSGGEIIKIEDWGSKKLAYLVKKRDRGRYILIDFVGLPAVITEMERQFKISEEVMKFLSVKLDDSVDLDAFKAAQEPPAEPEPPVADAAPEPEQTTAEAVPEPEPSPAEAAPEAVPEQPAEPESTPPVEEASTEEPAPAQEAAPTVAPADETPEQPEVPAAEASVTADEAAPSEPASEDKKEGE